MSYRDGTDQTQTGRLPVAPSPIADPVKVEFSYVVSLAWNDQRGRSTQGSIRDTYGALQYETLHEIEGQVIQDAIKALGIAPGTNVTVLFMTVRRNFVANELITGEVEL